MKTDSTASPRGIQRQEGYVARVERRMAILATLEDDGTWTGPPVDRVIRIASTFRTESRSEAKAKAKRRRK